MYFIIVAHKLFCLDILQNDIVHQRGLYLSNADPSVGEVRLVGRDGPNHSRLSPTLGYLGYMYIVLL